MKKLRKNFILSLLLALVSLFGIFGMTACGGEEKPQSNATYSVNFTDEDGNILALTSVKAGEVPVYTGEVPTKAQTKSQTFTFAGWKEGETVYETLPAISKNTTFVASFTASARLYEITFSVDGKNTKINVPYGEIPVYTGETEWQKDGVLYTITGWDQPLATVTGNKTYVAQIRSATNVSVVFDVDGESLEFDVAYGEIPKFYGEPYRKASEVCSYTFIGWTDGVNEYAKGTELPAASADVTYYAQFAENYYEYAVTFMDVEKTLYETSVIYGEAPVYVGTTPAREQTARASYSFVGWDYNGTVYTGELPAITGEATFYAVYEEVTRYYTVTVNYGGEGGAAQSVSYRYAWGDNYSIATPERDGYVANVAQLVGTVTGDAEYNVTYRAATEWNGTVVAFTKGSGTQADPYLIENASHLAYLSEQVDTGVNYAGKYFKLTADIDLAGKSWNAIGSYSIPFAGIFDGENHIVCGLEYVNTLTNTAANGGHALFSTISGTVKNLIVDGSVRSIARYTAVIVGYSNGGRVENCTAFGNVYGYGNVGGVVGLNSGTVVNCTNYATVTDNGVSGAYRFGGVVGCHSGSGKVEISGCVNYGTVRTDIGSGGIGGVVGLQESAVVKIYDCTNYGSIITKINYVGGVIGYAKPQGVEYTNLVNYGYVFGTNRTGGVAGFTCSPLKNCVNHGFVKGTQGLVAGVAGHVSTSAQITDCINYGTVISLSASQVGGVCGYSTTNITYTNCKNYGDVTGASHQIGGIVGYANTGVVVNGCINYGTVKGKYYVGGIAGCTVTSIVQNCTNYGDVSYSTPQCVSDNIGFSGISGWTTTSTKVSGCINYGNVTAYTNVGGVAGYLGAGSSVTGSSNFGRILGVSATNSLIGQNNNK